MQSLLKASFAAALMLSSLPALHAQAAQTDASESAAMSTGEIKKIDKSAGKLTIKHGPLRNLDMPAMTMVFRVKNPAMLDRVSQGEKISFVAEDRDGQLTVTRLEKRD